MSFREYPFKAGIVKRYHTVDMITEQTVAAHSWGVALIICEVVKKPSTELLKAALYHDIAEAVTGDIPATSKWRFGDIDTAVKRAEQQVEKNLGLKFKLTVKDKRILKFADMMELIIHAWREYRLGNSRATGLIDAGVLFLDAYLKPADVECRKYMDDVVRRIRLETERD